MESSNSLSFTYNMSDNNNLLFLLYNEVLFFFDGNKWGQILVSDVNLPGTDFRFLKKPALVEITPQKDAVKTFLVTGGFLPNSKSIVKTVYLLNIKKTMHKHEQTNKLIPIYDCLLDFKFGDMKSSRFLHGVVNIENKCVVVIGGKNDKGWLNTCEYLDLKSGEWKDFPSMTVARTNFDCLSFFHDSEDKTFIYAYGGFSAVGKYSEPLIERCEVNLASQEKSRWEKVNFSYSDKLSLPKISCKLVKFDNNILIIGGSDDKHLLKNVFELDTDSNEINNLGELKTPRNNFHVLVGNDYIFLVGGSSKKWNIKDEKIENYTEKFTFNLASQVESEEAPVLQDLFLMSLRNLSIDETEFLREPGFPYSSSIMTKKLN